MGNRLLAIGVIMLLLVSCASTNVAPVGQEETFQLQADEKRIWNRSREEQARLNRSNLIYDDPALTAYVNAVAQNLFPEDVKQMGMSIEVKIIKKNLIIQ